MGTTRHSAVKATLALVCILTCSFFAIPDQAIGQTAHIMPARINLTSEGLADAVQALIHMPIEDGYTLSGFDVQLMFGKILLADAYSFTYCDYDRAFMASFDKQTISDNAALRDVAGERVRLTVEGTYDAVNAEGVHITQSISCSGYVWITSPGRK